MIFKRLSRCCPCCKCCKHNQVTDANEISEQDNESDNYTNEVQQANVYYTNTSTNNQVNDNPPSYSVITVNEATTSTTINNIIATSPLPTYNSFIYMREQEQ